MTNDKTTKILLINLWHHIHTKRKYQLCGIGILMVISTVTDIISIGAIVPFLQVLISPEKTLNNSFLSPFVNTLGIINPSDLIILIVSLFIVAALFSGIMRIVVLWGQTRLGSIIGKDLSCEAYKRSLHQPYIVQISRNSSEITSVLVSKVHIVVNNIIVPLISLCSASILVISVVFLMLIFEPEITIISIITLGSVYLLVAKISIRYLKNYGEQITNGLSKITRYIIEGFSAIRDLILTNAIDTAVKKFEVEETTVRQANANIIIIGSIPRPIIETLVLIFFAGLAFTISTRPEGIAGAIPILGAMALAVQRVLPMAQQIYSSWTSITSGIPALEDVLYLLNQETSYQIKNSSIINVSFQKQITLKNISFKYTKKDVILLNKINLTIPRGSRLGIIGKTGSGKSTFLDIFMGLLTPSSGSMSVDNIRINKTNIRGWQANIAHVPQSIFLIDASVAENITFGESIDQIDEDRMYKAAERAQIHTTINSWPQKYKSLVGEKGVRLSGGQRQRIAIARALYQKADILVFDEATSALDSETESSLVDAINNLDKELTMLIIAHRTSTLKACTNIIKLDNGMIENYANYDEMVSLYEQKGKF